MFFEAMVRGTILFFSSFVAHKISLYCGDGGGGKSDAMSVGFHCHSTVGGSNTFI